MKNKATLIAALVLLSTQRYPLPVMAQTHCMELTPVDNSTVAYKDRGNRCEGFYESQVSAGSLDLVGLLLGKLEFDSTKGSVLRIFSPRVRKQEVHIQAVGIPIKTYYRLDAWLQPGESLEWPLEIIRKKRLPLRHIGLFGQLVAEPEVYVPLALGNDGTGRSLADLTLTLRASVDVVAVQWRQGSLSGQRCGSMSKSKWKSISPARGDYFYSGEAIEVKLPQQNTDFCIEFATQQKGFSTWLKLPVKIRMKD